jgi:hypothetical protein
MANRPKMPVPPGELTPRQLCGEVRRWAARQGYTYEQGAHGSEYAKVTVRDPAGGSTRTVVPNAHHGKRLRQDQVRYTVKDLNDNWED